MRRRVVVVYFVFKFDSKFNFLFFNIQSIPHSYVHLQHHTTALENARTAEERHAFFSKHLQPFPPWSRVFLGVLVRVCDLKRSFLTYAAAHSQICWPKNLFMTTTTLPSLSHRQSSRSVPPLSLLADQKGQQDAINQLQGGVVGGITEQLQTCLLLVLRVLSRVWRLLFWIDFFFAHRYQNQFDYTHTHTQCYLSSTHSF